MINKQNKQKIVSVLCSVFCSAKLWLTIAFTLLCLISLPKYYIVPTDMYGEIIYKFNGYLFLSIAAICILISYPIFSFISDLKTKQNKSISDILLLCVFFILLFIPASKINTETYSNAEHRVLAAKAHFFGKNNHINNNFGKDFEKWFNDRFFSREILITCYNKITRTINKNYNSNRVIINTKDKWFFFKREIKEAYTIPEPIEFETVRGNLESFNSFCKDNNIKLYFVIVPNKSNIYREYIPFHNLAEQKTYGEELFEYFNEGKDLPFNLIYPAKEMLAAKKENNERLFFSSDNHLAPYGGYIVYKTVMQHIKKDFPNQKIAQLTDFDCVKSRSVSTNEDENYTVKDEEYLNLGFENDATLKDKSFLNYEYKYFYPKKDSNIKTTTYDDPYLLKSKTFNNNGQQNLLLLGSSFIEQPKMFFRYSFKNLDKIRLNTAYQKNFHLSRFEDYITQEKPDVLIVIISEFEAHDYIKSMYDESIELEP